MSCSQESMPMERPGTARVLVTDLGGTNHMNPTPARYEDSHTEVELYLSPAKLESLCGTQDLSRVTSLEICVDTRESTLGDFGANLPGLMQLKMNNSMIMSVRDLGTTLSHLQVLWVSRCSLQDLDGISSLSSLKELYAAYNSVSDLSQVSMLENLQLLDLEGNDVDDLVQIQYLGLCSELRMLTLEGNPVCVSPHPTATQTEGYSYRAAVRELVPQLCYLDDVTAEEEGPGCSSAMGEDWAMLRDSIREWNSAEAAAEDAEETAASTFPYSRPSSAKRPASSLSCSRPSSRPVSALGSRPLSAAGSRPLSAVGSRVLSPPGSRPGSAESDPTAVDPDASILTHGAGKILFCGNPVQALRARREKLRTAPTTSVSTPRDLPIHVPEHTYDLEEPYVGERSDVLAELRAWREQHNKRLLAIEKERLPQVLTILHNDDEEEEEDDDDNEEEGLGITSDEEEGEVEKGGGTNSASPDSSFQSLSPDLSEALSSEVARPSLCPDSTLSPSPPLSATTAPGNRRPPGIRTRRLKLSQACGEGPIAGALYGASPTNQHLETRLIRGGESVLGLQRSQEVERPKVPLRPLTTHITHRPTTSPLGGRLRVPCSEMGLSETLSVNGHQTTRPPERPVITRPHTARAALQKHLQLRTLQPSRGSSHLD